MSSKSLFIKERLGHNEKIDSIFDVDCNGDELEVLENQQLYQCDKSNDC